MRSRHSSIERSNNKSRGVHQQQEEEYRWIGIVLDKFTVVEVEMMMADSETRNGDCVMNSEWGARGRPVLLVVAPAHPCERVD